MSRHVLDRGRLVGFRVHDDGSACVTVRRAAGDRMDYDASPDAAASIARDLATDDVEVLLTEAGLVERLAAETYDLTNALADARADLAAMHARPAPDDAGSLHAQIADLTRRLADAEGDRDRIANAVCRIADGGSLGDVPLRMLGAGVSAALAKLHPQPPHAGAADVERVVVAEGMLRDWDVSPAWVSVSGEVGERTLTLEAHTPELSTVLRRLMRVCAHRARVVVECLPPQREGDAAGGQSVADEREQQERGEGVGGVHGGNVGEGGGARELDR